MEIEYAEEAKISSHRHILSWRLVCCPFLLLLSNGSLISSSVCIASVIRVPYIAKRSPVDSSWTDADACIWSIIELNLAIVSACLPTLRPLFLHVFRGGYKTGSNSRTLGDIPRIRLILLHISNETTIEDGVSDVSFEVCSMS